MNLSDCLQEEVLKTKHQMKREDMMVFVKKRRECNARAQKIVEQLLDTTTQETFLHVVKYINQAHLDDVFEERFILRICGYPLCGNALGSVPKHRYRISTTVNKVYDITERKKFCSPQCFSAAKYIREQLPSSPLWVLEQEDSRKYKLWNPNRRSCLDGDEVKLHYEDIKKSDVEKSMMSNKKHVEVNRPNVKKQSLPSTNDSVNMTNENKIPLVNEPISIKNTTLSELCEGLENISTQGQSHETDIAKITKIETTLSEANKSINVEPMNSNKYEGVNLKLVNSIIHLENKQSIEERDKVHILCEKSGNISEPEDASIKLDTINKINLEKMDNTNRVDQVKPLGGKSNYNTSGSERKQKPLSILEIAKHTLHSWITVDSLIYLIGEQTVRQYCEEKAIDIEVKCSQKLTSKQMERYKKICKKLDLMELQEEHGEGCPTLNPLPDYNTLKQENHKLMVKVRAFFEGNTHIPTAELNNEVPDMSADQNSENNSFLPLTDHHDQKIMRRNIVLSFLEPAICKFLLDCKIKLSISSELRELVNTFELNSKTITFKPALQKLLALFVIKLLSITIKDLDSNLKSDISSQILTRTLNIYDISDNDFHEIISSVTDMNYVICKKK